MRDSDNLPLRAALLTRQCEVEMDLGRYFEAMRAADQLLSLALDHPEAGWMSTACVSVGAAAHALGDRVVAVTSAIRAADALEPSTPPWRPAVAISRLLCELDLAERAMPLLAGQAKDLPVNPLVDPQAQVWAALARVLAASDPPRVRDLAGQVSTRPPPIDRARGARALLDAGWAWLTAGHRDEAQRSAGAGLRLASAMGATGLRLELLSLLQAAQPQERTAQAIRRTVDRIARQLPADCIEPFRGRYP